MLGFAGAAFARGFAGPLERGRDETSAADRSIDPATAPPKPPTTAGAG